MDRIHALAIYALATLFNRRHGTADGGGTALEVVWAPVLLIHLGGQRAISAYSLEDNELWKRHTLTLVSQVTVALYVFCKWWPGDEKLLQAALLLFIVGIVKFAQKPWAVRKASLNSILTITSVSWPSTRQAQEEEVANPGCWTMFTASAPEMDLRMQKGREDEELASMSLEEYVQQASTLFADQTAEDGRQAGRLKLDYFVNKLFVDMSVPYAGRLMELRSFSKLDDKNAYHKLQLSLESIFNLLYTKEKALNLLGCSMQMLLPFLAVASVVLFAKTSKDGYDGRDVLVTYILFCCTAAQELSSLFPCIYCCTLCLLTSCLCFCFPRVSSTEEAVSQHNLLAVCACKKKPTFLMKIATFSFLQEYVNENCYIGQLAEEDGWSGGSASRRITGLVRRHVKDGWRKYIHGDTARYRCFANLRGQRSMRRHHQLGGPFWSLDMPFDESVLLWHIATDLCFFHHHNNSNQSGSFSPKEGGEATSTTATQRAREISNYMVYLLCICPEMLLPGIRLGLFAAACDNIELILKDSRAAELHKEQRLAQEILDRVKSSSSATTAAEGTTLITDACRLVEALMEMFDERERWQMIQGVWVEMLCYSAVRCRGYLHAKSLGEGGEFLSTVWLLWSFMGMETMPDRFQRPEPPKEEEEDGHGSDASSTRPTQGDGHDDQAAEISPV